MTYIAAARRFLCLWLLALPWACALAASAWERDAVPVFRHVSLPGDIVPAAMLQDREGLMWIASQTGLASWDGYGFQRYVADPSKPGSPPTGYVNVLHEDRQGRLWLGANGGGLGRLDKTNGRFWTLGAGPRGLSSPRVLALADDAAGRLWVGTAAGLDQLELATGRVVGRHAEGSIPPGLPVQRVFALLADRGGHLWVGTREGLYVLRGGAAAFEPVPLEGRARAAVEVRRVVQDSAGRIWIGTRATGAFVIEPGAASARPVRDTERSDGKGLETQWVAAIAEAGDHEVWLGTWAQGIVQVDTRTWTTRQLRHEPDVPATLAKDNVPVLLRDRSGLMWAAGPSLLDSHDPGQRVVSAWYGGDAGLLGGARTGVTALLAQPDGSVWLGSGGGGIDIVAADGRARHRLLPQDGQPGNALPASMVLRMVGAPDGSVYIGTGLGLYRARDGGRRVERVNVRGLGQNSLVRSLCVAGGRLWLGGQEGLHSIDLSANEPVAQPAGDPALKREAITALGCHDDGSLWVGTWTGLLRYRPDTGRVERPQLEVQGVAGLSSNMVTAIVHDKRGRLWAAFYGGGVFIVEPGVDGSAPRVRHVGHEEGLQNNAANALLLDAQGHAWVSADNGILRIDRDTLDTALLQKADGVGQRVYYTSAAAATPAGELLFGGDGLAVVHPDGFQPWRFKAPIRLADGDGQPVEASGITLGPSQRAVQVNFALLDYSAPERTRYAYRLVGLEESWTASSAELRAARYTNVPPGEYTLEVKAANRSGEWTTARWPLHVQPAWFETTAFRAAMLALALLLVGSLVRLRTRLLQQRAAELREQVSRRTQELELRTEELDASRKALREFGAHNARSLEEERKRVARELHDELGQQLAALRMEVSVLRIRTGSGEALAPQSWQQMQERVDRLVATVRGLVSDLRPPALDGGLSAAIDWLAAEFTRSTGLPCEVDVDPAANDLCPDVGIMLFRITQESLTNVRRHAQATRASVALHAEGDEWCLSVTDDGVGFDASSPRTGYGLLGMEERAGLLGGTLDIDSAPGRGTRVRVRVGPAAGPAVSRPR